VLSAKVLSFVMKSAVIIINGMVLALKMARNLKSYARIDKSMKKSA
jgi:hypothetical protein